MVETVSSIPLIIKINGLKTIPPYQHTAEPLYSGERKQEWMYGVSAKKTGRFREVGVSGGSTVDFIGLLAEGHLPTHTVFFFQLFLMAPSERIQTPSCLA